MTENGDHSPDGADYRLAAILAGDVTGYSRLIAEHEDHTVRTLSTYRREIERRVRQHRGRLVDFAAGDGLLAEFPSALYAVRCGLEIQGALEERNRALAEDRRVRFRLGIHLGEVRVDGERLVGSGVNVAARLEPFAPPGGLCISDRVRDEIRGRLQLSLEDLGPRELKNIADPVRVYRVGTLGEPDVQRRSTRLQTRPPATRARPLRWAAVALGAGLLAAAVAWFGPREEASDLEVLRSIAVLPLEDLSSDPGQEHFADGMTEALIGDLAKIAALDVISRTSVMHYKESEKSLPEIARELGVGAVVEGTVMRVGNRVRITAQLIDARRDVHLWSERYDRELSDVLDLQSEVARAISQQVSVELSPAERAALTGSRRVDPEAFDAYLRGLQFVGARDYAGQWAPRAIEQFEEAVALDPEFAEAWSSLARSRATLGFLGFSLTTRDQLPLAQEAAERALALDERLGSAHAVLADLQLFADWDFAGARRSYRRALELSPSDPVVLNSYAFYLLLVEEDVEKALDVSERLLRVAPLDLSFRADHFRHFFHGRRFDRALEEVARIRELDPEFVDLDIVAIHELTGQPEQAYAEYIAFYQRCGERCARTLEILQRAYAEGGYPAARRAHTQVYANREGFSPMALATMYSRGGEKDEAFAELERSYRVREPALVYLKHNPDFDGLHSDPRFDDLVRRVGFPDG